MPEIRVETKRLFLPRPVSSLLPKYTSEFTLMLKHLISGHMKREIQMCSCQWNSQFQYENEILSLSQKISFIMMHTAHALACLKVYNQKHPPPVGLISPCFFRSRNYPSTSCSQPLSVSFHSQAQHSALREHKV